MKNVFDLQKLLKDVFAPQPGETALVFTDLPHNHIVDNPEWEERRRMAEEWRQGFAELGLNVPPLLTYPATGANNSNLPQAGRQNDNEVEIFEVFASSNIAVAMTEYSATAPLMSYAKQRPGRLRAASMPGVLRRMEQSALSADYQKVARRVHLLAERLTRAESAEVVFSTGHSLLFDLRHRTAGKDDGQCTPDAEQPVINLPSGEAFIVPYEGERQGDPSRTTGHIPVVGADEIILLKITANRIEDVSGCEDEARNLREYFAEDPARRNVAELGLGCNDRALVTGNVLEDEKAGMHWAFGRSEHLGGSVAPEHFQKPEFVVHRDIVYARNCPIEIDSLTLHYPEGPEEEIMRNSEYLVF